MSISALLKKLPAAAIADAIDGMDCTIQLNLSTPAYLVISNNSINVHEGTSDAPDISLNASDEDLISLLTGKLDGVTAYLAGKLQVEGDLILAKQVPTFFDSAKLA